MELIWQADEVAPELAAALAALGTEYGIREGRGTGKASKNATRVRFEREDAPGVEVRVMGQEAVVRYSHTHWALRGVGALLAGLVTSEAGARSSNECGPGGRGADASARGRPLNGAGGVGAGVYRETSPFERFGIMLDCSRNAVMTVESLQRWLRRLALLGFNQIMLYTEDAYELPGEPYFGYLRGRYTAAELQALDAYARGLGVEMIGCIQTLAHLEQILRWPPYQEIKDYESVLLVGEEKTYALIGKMLDTVSSAITSRRIHVGMDEAWALGRGQYLDLHGKVPRFDILNQHLGRVVQMCAERGLRPMMWSDMYFMIGSPRHWYYDPDTVIPPEVAAGIPPAVDLVYWDYYHADPAFYRDWIARHRAMGKEPVMASGVWTWGRLWYDRMRTQANAGACLRACREAGVKEVFFTMWGDDGGYCDFDSALAGLAWVAERGLGSGDEAALRRRFAAVCGTDYDAVLLGCAISDEEIEPAILWDDPLLGILANDWDAKTPSWAELEKRYRTAAQALAKSKAPATAAGDLPHAALLAEVLARKVALRRDLVRAYQKKDRRGLAQVKKDAGELARQLRALGGSFRRMWMRKNKPEGFEALQIRLAGQVARHEELGRRIAELLAGKVTRIPELEAVPPKPRGGVRMGYRNLASGSLIQ